MSIPQGSLLETDTTGSPRPIAIFIRSLKGHGAGRSTINLANTLADRGHAVDLVVVRAAGEFLSDVSPRVRLVALASGGALALLRFGLRRPKDCLALLPVLTGRTPFMNIGAVMTLSDYLKRDRPIALLSALNFGNVAAVIAGDLAGGDTKIVLTQRNHLTSDIEGRRGRSGIYRRIMRRFFSRADAIVAVSQGVADDLALYCTPRSGRIDTIYNPVATPSLYRKAAAPIDHAWFGEGQPPVILGVGRLMPQKDFATLIKAFARVRAQRPAKLMILGEGDQRGMLQALVKAQGVADDVSLAGFSDNPFAYLTRADLFVLSSTFEGLPGVLIQALACGCPVVSTDCPSGPVEILEGGRHGALVPVGDVEKMAEAIVRALDRPADREALKARGAFFSEERAVCAYEKILGAPIPAQP